MVRAVDLHNSGQLKYQAGLMREAFDYYHRAIVQILDHEDIFQTGGNVPNEYPRELLGFLWNNLLSFFKSDDPSFTQEKCPSAYDLVYSFRPTSSSKAHPQFKGAKGQHLLKGLQITGGFALGILAWRKGDRATTAKRYKEALDIADAHPPFDKWTPSLKHLDWYDEINSRMAGSGQGNLRKDVLESTTVRLGQDGSALDREESFIVATDACGRSECTKRGVGFKRCSACKKIAYCGVECQKADWKKHKLTHN
ncbi:hypothetical protein R3P38DRAFT_2875214 [Favolaschia claudopus]|uniref:MYND-type domain-containing protein n=1 Tax=Favolaschia claudopus TaxID=2862362 RepID=A0AAW0D6P8_9AGAR